MSIVNEPRLFEDQDGIGPAGSEQRMRVAIKSGNVNAVPSGLTIGGIITQVTLSDTIWTAVPSAAFSNRNGLGIQNESNIKIKVNFDNTEPGFIGWTVNAGGELFVDITESVLLYAKSESGSPTLTVMEVA